MSGIVKSVAKVFKKVTKSLGKILPAVLAVGATVFTAGAALGLPGMAGGWGGAVSSIFGTGSTLSNVLSGAVTQAGYGAAIGGVGSMLGGGKFSQGAGMGAVAGAIGGGLMGGMGYGTDILGKSSAVGNAPGGATSRFDAAGQAVQQGGAGNMTPGGVADYAASKGFGSSAAIPASTIAAPVAAPVASGAGNGLLGWAQNNQTLVGNTLSGLGSGLMQGMAAKEATAAAEKEQRRITGSYNVDPSALAGLGASNQTNPQLPTPTEKYAQVTVPQSGKGRYVYDKDAGTVVWVNSAQA